MAVVICVLHLQEWYPLQSDEVCLEGLCRRIVHLATRETAHESSVHRWRLNVEQNRIKPETTATKPEKNIVLHNFFFHWFDKIL